MQVVSLAPFGVAILPWLPMPRSLCVSVCIKATFDLHDGREATLAGTPGTVHEEIYLDDDDPGAGLVATSDFVPVKPRADVVVVGSAHAPGGVPVQELTARFRIGELEKALRISGDRVWTPAPEGLRPGPARPFVQMPLRYDLAARRGENRAGVAPDLAVAGRALPNIDLLDEDRPASTPGSGPIPASWRALSRQLRGDEARWVQRLRELPAPAGFDFGFFNAAPLDQQTKLFSAAPEITLENLHPRLPRLRTQLPGVRPRAFHLGEGGRPERVTLACDTVCIDTARAVAVVSWRGSITIEVAATSKTLAPGDERALGRLVVVAEAPGERLRYEDVERMLRQRSGQQRTRPEALDPPPRPPIDEPTTTIVGMDLPPVERRANEPPAPVREDDVENEVTHVETLPGLADDPTSPGAIVQPMGVLPFVLGRAPDPARLDPEASAKRRR